jgi:hypothetical protein
VQARPSEGPHDVAARPGHRWESLPPVALWVAVGLALVAGAFALSRLDMPYGEPLFWLGLAAIVLPITFRLSSSDASDGERMVLVAMAGMALYAVKVMHDPFAFVSADELVHVHNVDETLRTGHLFGRNSILGITPLYPGLATATAALASTTGLSSFAAGVITIGVARLLFMLALYLFVQSVTRSSFAAGVAALVYTGTANFVFFSGSFSYESLALPLAMVGLLATAQWQRATGGAAASWLIVAVVMFAATVPTHHLTSYAIVVVLVAWTLGYAVAPRLRFRAGPWRLATWAVALVAFWLFFVASRTAGYLTPVITNALETTFNTLAGEAPPRGLFESKAGEAAPLLDRALGMASALAIVAILPFGLRTVWQWFRGSPPVVLLALAALAYPATQALRFVPGAWETGVRTTDFVFVGAATVIALAIWRWWPMFPRRLAPSGWYGRATLSAFILLVISGGIVTGGPHTLRLAQIYRFTADGDHTVDPPAAAAADWSRSSLPRGSRIAAEETDARLFQAYGQHVALAGTNPDVIDLLHSPGLEPWEPGLIRRYRLQYAAVNRRLVGADRELGYFFPWPGTETLRGGGARDKFDLTSRSERIFDSGDIVIYDISRIGHEPPPR